MSSFEWIHLIWLVGALVLVLSSYPAYNIGGKKTLALALVWIGIFVGAAGIASFFV